MGLPSPLHHVPLVISVTRLGTLSAPRAARALPRRRPRRSRGVGRDGWRPHRRCWASRSEGQLSSTLHGSGAAAAEPLMNGAVARSPLYHPTVQDTWAAALPPFGSNAKRATDGGDMQS